MWPVRRIWDLRLSRVYPNVGTYKSPTGCIIVLPCVLRGWERAFLSAVMIVMQPVANLAPVCRFLAIFAFCWTVSFPLASQDLKPLKDVISVSSPVYVPTRCAGLLTAMMEWTGQVRIGQETWQLMKSAVETHLAVATLIALPDSGNTVEKMSTIILRDASNIADLYVERMKRNYAAGGQAFGDDSLIRSDLVLCENLEGIE